MKTTRVRLLAIVACGQLCFTLCGCPKKSSRSIPTTKIAKPDAKEMGRVFTARVDEKNLGLADEQAAKNYLRQKLVGLLAEQLGEFGYPLQEAGGMAAAGKLEDFSVSKHEEKVADKKAPDQQVKSVVLWDVHGILEVELSDQQVDALGERLATLPVSSIEEAEAVAAYLERMRQLNPEPRKFEALRQQVGDHWAEALRPMLKVQLQAPVMPADIYLESLEGLAARLVKFRDKFSLHQEREALEKLFTLAALNVLHSVEVRAENHPALKEMLARLEKITKERLPDVMPYLLRDVELAWRNRLEKLSKDQVPFPQVYADFYLFLQTYPKSDFYPELELMFLVAWCDYLQARKVEKLKELSEYIKEVNLLRKSFPNAASGKKASETLGKRCVALLSKVAIPDLEALKRAKEITAACDAHISMGTDTVKMRKHLDQRESLLLREKDDRDEKLALRGLGFFIEWVKALRKLPWGKPRKAWTGQGSFNEKWGRGRDAGADCRCSLDPEEPCRVFEEEGPHGGFEVVARFYQDKLEGVDICQVHAGDTFPVIYRFYKRRYHKTHGNRAAAAFLSSAGKVSFGRGKQLRVDLERFSDSVTVRYRHAPLQAMRLKEEKLARTKELKSRKQARRDRIKKGWQPGDCVRWDCGTSRRSDCIYTGTVKVKKGNKYHVVVTESESDPVKQGRYLWVKEDKLLDCR
jgi:hypothetical protein